MLISKRAMQNKKLIKLFLFFFVLNVTFYFESCTPVTHISETAYTQSVRLKIESLELMKKAVNNYSEYAAKVDSLIFDLNFAYEYAKGRPNNEITTRQWEIMIDPDRNLIGGFLRIWKEDLKLSPEFISEAQSVIGEAYDNIIGLESGKIRSSDLPAGQTDKNEEK